MRDHDIIDETVNHEVVAPKVKKRRLRLAIAPRVRPLAFMALAVVTALGIVLWRREPPKIEEQPSLATVPIAPEPQVMPRLIVTTEPMGAEVRMGERLLGTTPLSLQISADQVGPILLTLDGHERWTGRPYETSYDRYDLNVRLRPGIDVQQWLDRPGVRLLAVQFYASWCAPCLAEAPHWEALAKKHRGDGLRVITVVTSDEREACASLPFSPDSIICDPTGEIASRMLERAEIPAAHLWTWQGRLLVKDGRLKDIEREVGKWALRAPRVSIEVKPLPVAANISEDGLRAYLRGTLAASDKLVLVDEERKRLTALEVKSCNMGDGFSPNSLLEAAIETSSSGQSLRLALFEVERACLQAAAIGTWKPEAAELSTRTVVQQLMAALRPTIEPLR